MVCHKLFLAEATSSSLTAISLTAISYHIRKQHLIIQTQNHSKEMPQTLEYWGVTVNGDNLFGINWKDGNVLKLDNGNDYKTW